MLLSSLRTPGPFITKIPQCRCCMAGPGRLVVQKPGTQAIRVKTVIGNHDHQGVRPRRIEKLAQVDVVQVVATFHHAFVELEILFRDPIEPGGMVSHEGVGKMVQGIKIDGRETPRCLAQGVPPAPWILEHSQMIFARVPRRLSFSWSTSAASGTKGRNWPPSILPGCHLSWARSLASSGGCTVPGRMGHGLSAGAVTLV